MTVRKYVRGLCRIAGCQRARLSHSAWCRDHLYDRLRQAFG